MAELLAVGLGTDGGNRIDSVNMLADMKLVALAQEAHHQRAAAIAGARVLGMEADIGSLEAGKMADLVVLDLDRANLVPRHSIAAEAGPR